MDFFYELFIHGSGYVVGGYFRDFLYGNKSRDIDIITDVSQDKLLSLITDFDANFKLNRHGGIKIILDKTEIDIWTLDNNWAFKNKLVKLNPNDKLNSIAKGCFYNFDSLVINLHTFDFNLRYYNECINNKELNILQESSLYKNLNPSLEANVLRALYLKKHYSLGYSQNTINYLYSKIGFISDKYDDPIQRILLIRDQYPKYSSIKENDILNLLYFLREQKNSDQLTIEF